jgi:hypothetical protein
VEDKPLEFWDKDEWMTIVAPWSDSVKRAIGSNLRVLQHGEKPASHCKTLRDFPIALLELWHPSGARVVCTTEYASLSNYIHVLDAFVKDSKEGKKMRPGVKDRIERRARDLKQRMDDLKKFNRQMSMVRSKAH